MIQYRRAADVDLAEVAAQPTVMEGASVVARTYDFEHHPYFIWMRDPDTTLEEFRKSQVPYRYLVENFSRAIAAVLARIPEMERRLNTVFENVQEEHGYGQLHRSHRSTYEGYLRSVGVTEEQLAIPCPIRIQAFCEGLLNFTLCHSAEEGAAIVGIIEYTHIKIATLLARTVHDRFWGDIDAQYHYRLHAELDVEHAADLFAVAEEAWQIPAFRHKIAYALALGAHYWYTLFNDLGLYDLAPVSERDGISEVSLPSEKAQDNPGSDTRRRRQHARIPCNFPVRLQVGDGDPFDTRARNISLRGILVDTDEPVPLDTIVHLHIHLPHETTPLSVTGQVRAVPKIGEGIGLGIEFQNSGPEQTQIISHALASLRPGTSA